MLLFGYYKAVADRTIKRRQNVMEKYAIAKADFNGDYTGIPMTSPFRGLDIQASVSVDLAEPSAAQADPA